MEFAKSNLCCRYRHQQLQMLQDRSASRICDCLKPLLNLYAMCQTNDTFQVAFKLSSKVVPSEENFPPPHPSQDIQDICLLICNTIDGSAYKRIAAILLDTPSALPHTITLVIQGYNVFQDARALLMLLFQVPAQGMAL